MEKLWYHSSDANFLGPDNPYAMQINAAHLFDLVGLILLLLVSNEEQYSLTVVPGIRACMHKEVSW